MVARPHRKTIQTSTDALDVHEAAWLLGAHVETLRRLARRDAIPAYKVGKDWRFSRPALERWMETRHLRERAPLVLLVDDEKSIRLTLPPFLKKDGYQVAVAADGPQAIALARRQPPDLVLLDLMLPGMNGIEVLKALHALNADLPVILITGYPDSHLIAEALHFPPVALLPKPVDQAAVRKSVRRMLGGGRPGVAGDRIAS